MVVPRPDASSLRLHSSSCPSIPPAIRPLPSSLTTIASSGCSLPPWSVASWERHGLWDPLCGRERLALAGRDVRLALREEVDEEGATGRCGEGRPRGCCPPPPPADAAADGVSGAGLGCPATAAKLRPLSKHGVLGPSTASEGPGIRDGVTRAARAASAEPLPPGGGAGASPADGGGVGLRELVCELPRELSRETPPPGALAETAVLRPAGPPLSSPIAPRSAHFGPQHLCSGCVSRPSWLDGAELARCCRASTSGEKLCSDARNLLSSCDLSCRIESLSASSSQS